VFSQLLTSQLQTIQTQITKIILVKKINRNL
jgi:hypothetical protein